MQLWVKHGGTTTLLLSPVTLDLVVDPGLETFEHLNVGFGQR